MEAIKCPVCGSGDVQELTQEKYVCLACDNVFLVHNLSKEFRQTDAHIADVHADISRKIDNLNAGMKNVHTEASGAALKASEAFNAAEESLKKGDFLEAYQKFKMYTTYMPDSYVGYEGMFRALTDNYKDDAGQYKRIPSDMTEANVKNLLADGTDVLSRALQCEDCKKEALLGGYKEYYERSLETLRGRFLYNTNPNDTESIVDTEQAIDNIYGMMAQCQSQINQINSEMVKEKEKAAASQKTADDFQSLSEAEKAAVMKKRR